MIQIIITILGGIFNNLLTAYLTKRNETEAAARREAMRTVGDARAREDKRRTLIQFEDGAYKGQKRVTSDGDREWWTGDAWVIDTRVTEEDGDIFGDDQWLNG